MVLTLRLLACGQVIKSSRNHQFDANAIAIVYKRNYTFDLCIKTSTYFFHSVLVQKFGFKLPISNHFARCKFQ